MSRYLTIPDKPLSSSILLVLLLFVPACNFSSEQDQHATGDNLGGGVVFIVFADGQAMTVFPESLGEASWGAGDEFRGGEGEPHETLNRTRSDLGTGEINTIRISNAFPEEEVAANLVRDFRNNGFGDYFLPSLEELNQVFHLEVDGERLFPEGKYWSSTCHDRCRDREVRYMDFETGGVGTKTWDAELEVIAIRTF